MTIEEEIAQYKLKDQIDKGTLITAHVSDLHFPVMDPYKQYSILEDQFLQKIEKMPRLDLVCVNGDLFDHKVQTSSDATKLQKVDFVISIEDLKKIQDYYFPIYLKSKADCPKFIESLKQFIEENS